MKWCHHIFQSDCKKGELKGIYLVLYAIALGYKYLQKKKVDKINS